MRSLQKIALISLAILVCGCSKVPGGIIKPHDMAKLMADVHIGESVVEMDRATFRNDSMRQAMKQSIYERHGYTTEQVDTSFSWYGHHIEMYMEVYDEAIEILEKRLIESGNRVAALNALSIAGDSVDVWPNARFVTVNDRMPSRSMTFSFDRDPNWERGDNYTWRAKFFNIAENSWWLIGAEYADGTVETISSDITGDGWKEIKLQTDSLLDPTRIFGFLILGDHGGPEVKADSLEMVRKRRNPEAYRRPFSLVNRKFYPAVKLDSIPTDSAATE